VVVMVVVVGGSSAGYKRHGCARARVLRSSANAGVEQDSCLRFLITRASKCGDPGEAAAAAAGCLTF